VTKIRFQIQKTKLMNNGIHALCKCCVHLNKCTFSRCTTNCSQLLNLTFLSKNEKQRLLRWPCYLWGCTPFQFLNQMTKFHETSYRHYATGGQPTPYLLYSLHLKSHINLWGGSNTSAQQRFSLAFGFMLIINRFGMEIQT
jgi:hypothetical protein